VIIKVVKNTRTVGTPNIKIITGNYFWSGAHEHIRRKIKREMADFFCPFLSKFKQVKDDQYPIGIRIDLYDEMEGGTHQDIDNFIFLYIKLIHDLLVHHEKTSKNIKKDDSKEYIQDIPTTFHPIENHDDRKLVVEIYTLE